MGKIMGTIQDKIERALFGATAAEVVEMRTELAARRAQQRIEQNIIEALESDDDEPHQCAQCGEWAVYGSATLCDLCVPDDEMYEG